MTPTARPRRSPAPTFTGTTSSAEVVAMCDFLVRWAPLYLVVYIVGAVLALRTGPVDFWPAALGALAVFAIVRAFRVGRRRTRRYTFTLRGLLLSLVPFGVVVGAAWLLFGVDAARSATVGYLFYGACLVVFVRVLAVPLLRFVVKQKQKIGEPW